MWGEQTTIPAKSAGAKPLVHERVLYYSFNVGQWQRQLNSETSVLTRAFITQPLLVFLPGKDQAAIAAQLVKTPLFKQAVVLHQEQVNNPLAGSTLLDDLIEALGEQGVAQLTTVQKQSSGQVFQSRIKGQRAIMSATAAPTGISFVNPGAPYEIFEGMDVNGKIGEQLEFTSYSSLYYGVQELANFEDTTGDFWARAARHFSNVPLIEPVTGWLDKDLVKRTPMGVSGINPLLKTVGNSAQVVIFRNNPNTALDAPMAMNLMTAGALMLEVVGTSAAVFKPKLVKDLMTRVQKFTDTYKPYLDNIAIAYTVTKSVQKLMCTVAEEKEGICGDYFKIIDSIANLLALAKVPLSAIDSALKDGEKDNTFDPATFCGGAILEKAKSLFGITSLGSKPRKSPLLKNTAKTRLAICAFDQIATRPLLKLIKANLPYEYEQIQKSPYKSIMLSADFFKRTNAWNVNVGFVPKGFQLESLVAKLGTSNVYGKEILQLSVQALDVGGDTLKFVRAVQTGKVEMMPLFRQLYDALQDYFNENGNQILSAAIYDVFKALTPAKYVQMAYTIGNKGTALAWDWAYDPALVKLTMTRDTTDTLAISTLIPKMKAVRYLKIPVENPTQFPIKPSLVLDYSGGLNDAGNMPTTTPTDKLLAVSNAPDTNHLLVYTGFKASVENQSAFLNEDAGAVSSFLNAGNIRLRWHVKRFANSASVVNLPFSARTAANAFNGSKNNIDVAVEDGWFPSTDPIVTLKSDNPLHQSIFKTSAGDSTLADYSALDFTEIYRNKIGDAQAYPLTHLTPGIYSDYTHIQIKSGPNESLYQNTFNIYVLPKLNAVLDPNSPTKQTLDLDDSLNKASRKYCEEDTCIKNGELQLNFASSAVWDQIGKNGLWAVWMQADGIIASEPVAVRASSGGNVTSTLRMPNTINVKADYLIVYEDVMNGYLLHSGKNKVDVLKAAFDQRLRTDNRRYPVIALKLSELTFTDTALLKPLDTDKDGVPDDVDAFPNDSNYAYDTDGDTMPDEWENQYGLDLFTNDAALDLDNDGLNNLDEFIAKTDPRHLGVTLTIGSKQVTLTWQKPIDTVTQSICWATAKITDPANCFTATPDGSDSTLLENQTSPAVIKNLLNGKTYYFAVIAKDSTGKAIVSKLLTATPQKPYTINDTGITPNQCYQLDSNALVACTSAAAQALNKKQDGMVGRDVTANNNSDGHAGFSFTKISGTGAALPVTASSWACVQDKVTGLMWENKTADGGLHNGGNRYTNYSADYGSGNLGLATDASGFIAAVNQQTLCGASGWRLPTADELQSLVDYSIAYPGPTIDTAFFPNTQNYAFWSSSPSVGYADGAWYVDFGYGYVYGNSRDYSFAVRLVRASQ